MKGINSIGFAIFPMSKIAIIAKETVYKYCTSELKKLIKDIENLLLPTDYIKRTTYINITEGAYPDETEREIFFFTEWNKNSRYSAITKNLVSLCILNSLEKVSYTAKDGQYLRMGL